MCGIAGYYNFGSGEPVSMEILSDMISMLVHRGPDEFGMYRNGELGMVQSRLSIIDLEGGSQPIHNEDKSVWIVFNGEIFNYVELREELKQKGHLFYTHTDTEVLVHLYESYGYNMLDKLNGQFAFTIYDTRKKEVFAARDHAGIIPFFFSVINGKSFLFGSEMKALFRHPSLARGLDAHKLFEIFSLWVNIPGHTPFKNIHELKPGHFLVVNNNGVAEKKYWDLEFPVEHGDERESAWYRQQLRDLLQDAAEIRLRADVPVGSYLSGGLDSSIVAALINKYHSNKLETFSVAFDEGDFDESEFQFMMAEQLGTAHSVTRATNHGIASALERVIWHAERPSIRTAPSPLFLLSELVRSKGYKVVLTGEGADEAFAGYNIFKEAKVRTFLAGNPESAQRENLLFELYPYVKGGDRAGKFWLAFFKKGLENKHLPYFSHLIRWSNTAFIASFLNDDLLADFNLGAILEEVNAMLPAEINQWHALHKAQYLETKLFLPGYLLSTQGDRMLMANSVEGRFPYLDRRVMEFASDIPPYLKMPGLKEKHILKETFKDLVPDAIVNRPKQPYRAPIYQSLLGDNAPESISHHLEPDMIEKSGIFNNAKVHRLIAKGRSKSLSEKEEMALVSILTTQILYHHFITDFPSEASVNSVSIQVFE